MKIAYCKHCGKETGFKRSFGLGTVVGLLLTFGLWVIAMPLYTPRCTECGAKAYRPVKPAERAGNY